MARYSQQVFFYFFFFLLCHRHPCEAFTISAAGRTASSIISSPPAPCTTLSIPSCKDPTRKKIQWPPYAQANPPLDKATSTCRRFNAVTVGQRCPSFFTTLHYSRRDHSYMTDVHDIDNNSNSKNNNRSCIIREHENGEEEHLDNKGIIENTNIQSVIEDIRKISLSLTKDQVMNLSADERYRYRIKQLLDYNATFATMDVPYNYEHDIQFAKWVQSQRYEYKLLRRKKVGVKSYLTPERVQLLDAIGFPWNDFRGTEQEGLSNRWMSNWNLLREYKQENGHVRVPESCVYKGVKLGVWVKNQRRNAKTQQHQSHDEDRPDEQQYKIQQRVNKLNELGFIWDTKEMGDTVYNATWMERYNQLKDFYENHGHFHIPREHSELLQWTRTQRSMLQPWKEYHHHDVHGNITMKDMPSHPYILERVKLLNDIHFDWNIKRGMETRRNDLWWKRYEELRRFHKHFGHTHTAMLVRSRNTAWNTVPPMLADIDLDRLHRWTKTQRVRYNQYQKYGPEEIKSINEEKIHAMTKLGFVWDEREQIWQSKFQQWKEFGATYKHFRIPTTIHPSTFSSDSFQSSSSSTTTTLGGRIWKHVNHYPDQEREEYMRNIIRLGKWARNQRFKFRKYKRGETLSPRTMKYMKILDEASFLEISNLDERIESASEKNATWDKYYSELQKFQQENGHCFVPGCDKIKSNSKSKHQQQQQQQQQKLYEWVTFQRRKFRSILKRIQTHQPVSEIDVNRLERLQKIGFIFNLHDFKFECSLQRLKEYHSKFGHTNVCPSYSDDPQLYTFVRRQRYLYRERKKGIYNSLTDERIEKMSRLDFVWTPRDSCGGF